MYFQILSQMKKQLNQVVGWLAAATSYAESRSFDPNVFLSLRLAPDQFPLIKQVQIACDTAKLMTSRLTAKEAPKHADDEQTLEEVRARVLNVISYLDGVSPQDLEAAPTRVISNPRWGGKVMTGADYFIEHAVPNFFFHITHVYAILRHAGVPLGKADYLGPLTQRMP